MENIFGYKIHSGSNQVIKLTGGSAVETSTSYYTKSGFQAAFYNNEIDPEAFIFVKVDDKYKKAIIAWPIESDSSGSIELYYEDENSNSVILLWSPSGPNAEEILVVTFYAYNPK